jgi:glycosyltransferase involved in cell wall biosynthesis
MRIGFLLPGSLSFASGGFLYDRILVSALRSRGDSVSVFSLPWRPLSRALAANFSPSLVHRLLASRFDLLLQDELAHPSLFLLNRRLKSGPCPPLVAIVHHLRSLEPRPPWQNRFLRSLERSYLRSLDAFIFNSLDTARTVTALADARAPSVVAYPAGDRLGAPAAESVVLARCAAPGPLRIVFVGNLIPRKGLHTLLAALALVDRGQWRLSIVGSGVADPSYAALVHDLARTLGFEANVTFHDTVPDALLPRLLCENHVLAAPSSYEGFGIVYLEAMCFGLPVIATSAGGAVEIVEHGVDGFLVDPADTAGLTRYIGRLAADRRLLASMGLAALRAFSRRPTWAEGAELAYRFLHGLVLPEGASGKGNDY